jgi:hypothetical protein
MKGCYVGSAFCRQGRVVEGYFVGLPFSSGWRITSYLKLGVIIWLDDNMECYHLSVRQLLHKHFCLQSPFCAKKGTH